jgi:hypothetical protein
VRSGAALFLLRDRDRALQRDRGPVHGADLHPLPGGPQTTGPSQARRNRVRTSPGRHAALPRSASGRRIAGRAGYCSGLLCVALVVDAVANRCSALAAWRSRRFLGAGSGGCTPRSGPAPASPARTAACLSPGAWPGGLPCPWTRGTVDTVACHQATRGKRWSQRSRPVLDQVAEWARLGCRLGWWGACGLWSGMPAPSGQIPPPWAWWENEAPTTRAACSSSQAQPVRLSTSCKCGVGMRWAGRWNSAPEGLWGRTTVRT